MSSSSMTNLVQLATQWGPFAMTALRELRDIDANYRVPQNLHAKEMNVNSAHHKQELKLAIEQHKGGRMLSQQLFFMQTYTEFQRQAVQLDADLVNAQKEAERDMYDQRNHQLQTLVVSVTVMFAALSTVMVEGKLSDDVSFNLTTAFAIANGLSFAFLFVCMVLCIELLILASRFMVNKAKSRFRKQDHARKEFGSENEKFKRLYEEQISVYAGISGNEEEMKQDEENVQEDVLSHDFDPLWGKKMEAASEALIQKRRDINGSFISKENETFEFFWDSYCDYEATWAIICFYLGTGFMLVSIVLYLLGRSAQPTFGGYVGSIFIIFSLCFGIWLAWRTQKIYAGEWKIRVKLPTNSPRESAGTGGGGGGFFGGRQKAKAGRPEWRDGKIVEVDDYGHNPTFKVAYDYQSECGYKLLDNVPLSNLRLKQKGIYKNTFPAKKEGRKEGRKADCDPNNTPVKLCKQSDNENENENEYNCCDGERDGNNNDTEWNI